MGLIEASEKGLIEIVHRLIEKGADKEVVDEEWGRTPLYRASAFGRKDVVELLLQAGADKDKAQKEGATPLHIASQNGHKDVVELLLQAGADKDKADKNGFTPLYVASQNGHQDIVELLLRAGADKDKVQKEVATPLYVASQNGHKDVVELLLQAGADRDKARETGATPLFIASEKDHKDVVELLLRAGADKDKARNDSATPLYVASHNGHKDVVELLLQAGAERDKAHKDGCTPLCVASQNGHKDVVELLLRAGADKDKARNDSATPLYIASQNGHKDVVELLLRAGADEGKLFKDVWTPLQIALHKGHKDIADLLHQAGRLRQEGLKDKVNNEKQKRQLELEGADQERRRREEAQRLEERRLRFLEERAEKEIAALRAQLAESTAAAEQLRRQVSAEMVSKIPFGDLTVGREMGEGQGRTVYEGTWCGIKVTLARVNKLSDLPDLAVLAKIGARPYIPRMLGVSEGPDGHGWLVQEQLPLGSLDKHLESLYDRGKTLPARDCLLILSQVTEALIALHGQGIIHRDLAARNVLIASLVPLRVKVTGFDLVKSSTAQMFYGLHGAALPFRVSAPEIFVRNKFSPKSDVFALGVLAWELFTTGAIPWGAEADKASVSAAVQRGERLSKDKFPDPVFERLIAPMWAESWADRPEPSAVLQIIDALLPLFPSSGQQHPEWECPVCMLPRELKSTLDACGHIFCDDCAFEASRRARCHTCNKPYAGHRRVFFR